MSVEEAEKRLLGADQYLQYCAAPPSQLTETHIQRSSLFLWQETKQKASRGAWAPFSVFSPVLHCSYKQRHTKRAPHRDCMCKYLAVAADTRHGDSKAINQQRLVGSNPCLQSCAALFVTTQKDTQTHPPPPPRGRTTEESAWSSQRAMYASALGLVSMMCAARLSITMHQSPLQGCSG